MPLPPVARVRSSPHLTLAAALASLLVLLFALLPSSAPAAGPECKRRLNDATSGERLKPPVTSTPNAQSAQRQVNFGTDREVKPVRNIRLTLNRRLPDRVTPDQINFEALISRSGDSLESIDFPDPTFTDPWFGAERKAIAFTVCLDPEGVAAGKYVGAITVSGPPGLTATSVNLTVTAKNGCLFWIGAAIALVVAFLLLLFKDAAAAFKGNWCEALTTPLKDLRWWGASALGLGAAFGTLYAIYANDPSWGASGVGAVIALIGSSFAAIGGKSIASAFAKPATPAGE